jgi:hypothetical protein
MNSLTFDLEEFVDVYWKFIDLAMQDDGVDLKDNTHPKFGFDYQERLAKRLLYSDRIDLIESLAKLQGIESWHEYQFYLVQATGSYDWLAFRDRMRQDFGVEHCPAFANLYMSLVEGHYYKK